MIRRPLIIGFGNALRGDDGVGWVVARLLFRDPRFNDADVTSVHQLTPELAESFANASTVVLVDAAADDGLPGEVNVVEITPGSAPMSLSHYVDARAVVALADVLYGSTPRTFVVSVSLATAGPGEGLSRDISAAVPRMVDAIANLALEHADA